MRQPTEPTAGKAPPLTAYATKNRPALVYDNLEYVMNPEQPRQPQFTRHNSFQWACLKAARDSRAPQGMENQAIPEFEDLSEYVIVGVEHSDYYLAGWADYNVRGERTY